MKKFLLCILSFTFVLISCNKGEDNPNSNPDPNLSYRITKIKYTYGPSPDEHQITFTYLENKIYLISDIWSSTQSVSYAYSYDNNNRVSEIQITRTGNNGDWWQVTQKVLYFYENNVLVKIKDTISKDGSYKNWREKTEANITYSNDRIDSIKFNHVRFYSYYSPPNVIIDSSFANGIQLYEYAGNNLSKSTLNGVSITYEYDNYKNPFKLIGIAPIPTYQSFSFDYLPVNDIFFGMIGFSENNAIKFSNNGSVIETLVLEYNSSGYPIKFITTHGSNTINGTIEYDELK